MTPHRLLRRPLPVVAAVLALLLAGCGTRASIGAPPEAVTETVTAPAVTVTEPAVTVTEPAVTVTAPAVTVTADTADGVDEPRPTGEVSGSGDSGDQVAVPSTGVTLGLDDFFDPDSSWKEGRWNVANRLNEQGIAGTVQYGNELEVRLQNQYSTLSFDAGQSNNSPSSDCWVKLDVLVDGELRETHEFGFNVVQSFTDIDVRDGNAVRLELSRSGCNRTLVVLSRIQVE